MKFTQIAPVLAFSAIAILSGCKKDTSELSSNIAPAPTVTQPGFDDKLKDSVMLFTRDLYLWHKNLPATFNERSYSDPQKIMAAIQSYSTEPGFSKPVDRWSFAMKQSEWNKISSGIAGDFGFGVLYHTENDLRVKYVEAASPAGKAGIRRGWRITKINGNTNVNYSNKDFVSNAVFNSTNSSFGFELPDGSAKDVTITAGTYQEHPIFLDSVYSIGAKKVGYLVFNSFLGDTSRVYQQFNSIFSGFSQKNVTDVVIDLRYNGGGYVSMQEKLANYLVKPSANGDVMMKQQFNEKLSEYNETTRFRKIGSLNLDRIIFIVSKGTASASELLINNLKPYMDVKVFGPSNTHGKPVGFFPYPVSDWYIFPVSFRTVNKSGQGNYFDGIELTSKTADGVDKDWGDTNEASLAGALKYIVSGSFRINSNTYNENPVVRQANLDLDAHTFKGAINTRRMR